MEMVVPEAVPLAMTFTVEPLLKMRSPIPADSGGMTMFEPLGVMRPLASNPVTLRAMTIRR